MDDEKIRHFRWVGGRGFWGPSKTVAALGMAGEPLGDDRTVAEARARILNKQADDLRQAAAKGANSAKPGTVGLLFLEYQKSDEFGELKPRTRRDYNYYTGKIEAEFGKVMVRSLSPKVLKTYYKRLRAEKGINWSYHVMATYRAVLTWAVTEDWIKDNPALKVRVKSPKKRDVTWTHEETETYLAQAAKDGWGSIVAMVHVFDSIGQSPVDVRTLPRSAYVGGRINVSRQKTGVKGAPIELFADAKIALDAYLATQPAKLPNAPLFSCETTGEMWGESHLQHTHADIRLAAGLRFELQLQDFRTTVQTEGGAAGGTVDELRGLGRHASRSVGEHYVHPNGDFIDNIQAKRVSFRLKKRGSGEA